MLANHLGMSYSIYVIKRKGITMIQGMQMEISNENDDALQGAKAFYTISCRNNDGSFYDCVDSFDDVDKMTYAWCQDTGYLYSKDEKMLKIFTSYSYDGDKLTIGNVTVFPRSVVKKIEVLK